MLSINIRRTGKSTAIALKLLSEAIESPGKPIKAIDHVDTPTSNRVLADKIMHIAKTPELDIFLNRGDYIIFS